MFELHIFEMKILKTPFRKNDLVIVRRRLSGNRYVNDILQSHLVPYLAAHPNLTFQQDNVPDHAAQVTTNLLNNSNIQTLRPWPADSPDLNLIEPIWDQLERRVRDRPNQPKTVAELENALIEEWNNIPQRNIQNQFNSMRRRLQAVIDARGGNTKY